MSVPTEKDLKVFLDVFERLSKFEAEQRLNRGYGSFSEEEISIPQVKTVLNWLRQKAKASE